MREQLDEAQTIAARLRRGSVEGEEELETARRRVRELEAERNAALDKVACARAWGLLRLWGVQQGFCEMF